MLNVFFRDVGQFVGIVLQFWFWFTPIVYSSLTLPASIQPVMRFNPMVPLVEAYQRIYLYHQSPHWARVWPVAIFALVLCAMGWFLFRRRASEMVDEL